MATTIQPMDYRSTFSIGVAQFLKRAGVGVAVALCALAFVVMAASAADRDPVPRPVPALNSLGD